jgi:hypothetical protein
VGLIATSRFSPGFIELCLQRDLSPGDSMPCPRCNDENVRYRTNRRWRAAAFAAAGLGLVLWLIGQANLAMGSGICAVILLLVFFAEEPGYVCGHCGFTWRHRDVVKWTKAIRHDLKRTEQ